MEAALALEASAVEVRDRLLGFVGEVAEPLALWRQQIGRASCRERVYVLV